MFKMKFIIVRFLKFFQIKYVGYRDRPLEERQLRFQTECREGNTSIVSHIYISWPFILRLKSVCSNPFGTLLVVQINLLSVLYMAKANINLLTD